MKDDEKKPAALNLSKAFDEGADMSAREEEILEDIVKKTHFEPAENIWRSSYWGTKQIGAVSYRGMFKGESAVLKIQGVKPDVSEIYMLEQFAAQNRSTIVRPPTLYATLPWNDQSQYEALIMEHVSGPKVLTGKILHPREDIDTFVSYYQEYRAHCLPQHPWLSQPAEVDIRAATENYIKHSQKAYPDDLRRQVGDAPLALSAADVLTHVYKDIPLEFIHGHFSVEDLIRQENQVVLFSNLFWKWRYPLYDAVFGYHWFMYELNHVPGITPEKVEEQRKVWMDALFDLPQVKGSESNQRLLKAALLERAMAGMILDSFLVEKEKPIAQYLTQASREQVKELSAELSS